MIKVKSCRDINGNRIEIGDKVRYVGPGVKGDLIRTVSKILKAGYFIEIHFEGFKHPWYMPKLSCEKVLSIDSTEST